jgi:hypothetical protein
MIPIDYLIPGPMTKIGSGERGFMTLKEKVAEVEPEEINKKAVGGVNGCPSCYEYLDIPRIGCSAWMEEETMYKCEDCWNREYKEPTNEH